MTNHLYEDAMKKRLISNNKETEHQKGTINVCFILSTKKRDNLFGSEKSS